MVSASREEISKDSCKSSSSSQANVGFRPSMTFTAYGETAEWQAGSPVDLFFLFDATSSQNKQLTDMVEQAKKIIKLFAKPNPNNPSDESWKDACHVTSALFQGPTLRLMCAEKVNKKPISQTIWGSYTQSYASTAKQNEFEYKNI